MGNHEIGAFAFENNGDGCINGKYLYNGSTECFAEAAVLTENDAVDRDNPFCGSFFSTWIWIEKEGKTTTATLTIRKSGAAAYLLSWEGEVENYKGEGMLVNGLLVGWYKKA